MNQTSNIVCVLIYIRTKGEVGIIKPLLDLEQFLLTFEGSAFFVDPFGYLCFMFIFVMLSNQFLAALWSPARKA